MADRVLRLSSGRIASEDRNPKRVPAEDIAW
jgi:hypothetical protein